MYAPHVLNCAWTVALQACSDADRMRERLDEKDNDTGDMALATEHACLKGHEDSVEVSSIRMAEIGQEY